MEMKGFQRSYLAKLAHGLQPAIMLGSKGLTEALIKQTEETIELKELIKVKFVDYKSSREELSRKLAEAVDAELIRVIGHTAVLYRRARDPEHRNIELPTKK